MQSDFVNLKVESPEPVKYKVERWSVAASIGSTVFLLWPLSYIIIGFTAIVVRGVLYLVHVLGFDVDAVPDLVVIVFAFCIGFSTTMAEPSLIAVALKASEISTGAISPLGLRVAVALGVAVGVGLGAFRIVMGIPLEYFIIGGYIFLMAQTYFAPKFIVPLAYDSGGVTTSTVTVPLVVALGIGLAANVPGRSPLIDGFGLIAFASLFPIISVLGYAMIGAYIAKRKSAKSQGTEE